MLEVTFGGGTKAEGATSKAPLTEAFGQWRNLKIVILALVGLTAGQAVVWYTGQFYSLFFLTQVLKVDAKTANLLQDECDVGPGGTVVHHVGGFEHRRLGDAHDARRDAVGE